MPKILIANEKSVYIIDQIEFFFVMKWNIFHSQMLWSTMN